MPLSVTQLFRSEPGRRFARLLAPQPPWNEWQRSHQEPIEPAWEQYGLSALESRYRFARTLRCANSKELRGRTGHASHGPGRLIEFAVHRAWAYLCHDYAGSRKIGPQCLAEPCHEMLAPNVGRRVWHHGDGYPCM